MLCKVMDVSRSGYYHWVRVMGRPVCPVRQTKLQLVKQLSAESNQTYGSRRIAEGLKNHGHPVSRGQARRLMREAAVWVRYRRRYRVTTDSGHAHPVYPNLVARNFDVSAPNKVWAGDITYIWTQAGWLYLAVVIDLYSRKVVGWSMSKRINRSLVCDALQMALWRRHPVKGELIFHSDRGSQYASKEFGKLLMKNGIRGSMSRKGDCWDNAVIESFFGSLKCERVLWRSYQDREEARADIVDYIVMFYNSRRLHSYLGYQSPDQYEGNCQMAKAA